MPDGDRGPRERERAALEREWASELEREGGRVSGFMGR